MKILAVVGMGSIAKRHVNNLRQLHPNAIIYAVSASGNNTTLPENADAVINLNDLIALAPDYVVVASPAPFHIDIAQKLLAHNIAVLIEKPLAQDVQSCLALQAFCNKQPRKAVAVGYCLRFLPSALVVKDYLNRGLLGPVYNVHANVGQYLPGWRADKSYKDSVSASKALGGGALLELSHELDYLHWLLGDLTLQHSLLRTTDELDLEVEDIANLVLLSEKNVYVFVHLDFIQKSTQRNCEFIGQHGRLVWDLLANTVTLYHATGKETLYAEPDYNKNNMYLAMLTAFENMQQGRESQLATLASATKVIKLIDDAKQQNKWGQQG
ncbi:Gfo/Idh/MocA family protein [Rheinheimera sp.]|uniref:Gfo/Idh/MocA family protein n=1 Tax=Rheinheimera sp. TaxID=1869214 RepID=UPI0040475D98